MANLLFDGEAGDEDDENDDDDEDDEEGEFDEEDLDEDDDEDDDNEDDEDLDEDEEDDDEDDDDDDDEEEDEKEEESNGKRKAPAKTETNKKAKQNEEAPKLVKNEPEKQQPQAQQPQQKKIKGGVLIKDLKEGKGPEAKKGKTVHVYYTGRLKTNGKQFDACVSGKPFKFRLGGGEVIKGWDVGFENMKVGGKRQIICPPNMAYGSQRVGPDIPPNSTLVFDVELKAVN